jgi:LacI family transcriptional regulator
VTVIAQDVNDIGVQAARLLFARIDGNDSPPQRIIIATQLITRGSGELTIDLTA